MNNQNRAETLQPSPISCVEIKGLSVPYQVSFLPSEPPKCKPPRNKERREYTPVRVLSKEHSTKMPCSCLFFFTPCCRTPNHKASTLSEAVIKETAAPANFGVRVFRVDNSPPALGLPILLPTGFESKLKGKSAAGPGVFLS